MAPTIEKGDVFFSKQAYYGLKVPFQDKVLLPIKSPQRGDIVVFKFPKDEKKSFIKRVIGLPGETIEGRDKEIYINGQKLTEPYIIHDLGANAHVPELDHFGPVAVPPGEYFVLGDNRDHSLDSRFWGPVSLNKIQGKATVIYWSWDRERGAVRWNRIGRVLE
jgi:signal peptidase I